MWVKICGITTIEDAHIALRAGADAIGLIFADSPRRVTVETARRIVKTLPPSLEKIGVFVNAPLAEVITVCRAAALTGAQLHGAPAPDDALQPDTAAQHIASGLHAAMASSPGAFRVVRVVPYSGHPEQFLAALQHLQPPANASQSASGDAVLVDTAIAGKHGGTGLPFDWNAARQILRQQASPLRLIAAGGLRPENVRQAIAALRPWGVDVSSGVEQSPGKKDPERVASFVREAWAADRAANTAAQEPAS
jgi:phosphoribosylanthranilate isomerase